MNNGQLISKKGCDKSPQRYLSTEPFLSLQCRDTYWVESFDNCILIYCPKRIHFADRTFNMRISLAVMDWLSQTLYGMVLAFHNLHTYQGDPPTCPFPTSVFYILNLQINSQWFTKYPMFQFIKFNMCG